MKLMQIIQNVYQQSKFFLEKRFSKIKSRLKPKAVAVGTLILGTSYFLDINRFFKHFLNFLSIRGKYLLGTTLVSGLLANSTLDEKFSKFWREHIKSNYYVNRTLKVCKRFGEYGAHFASILLIIFIVREARSESLTGESQVEEDRLKNWAAEALFNFASCTLVQAASCLFLGGSRPAWNESSSWRPCRRLKVKQKEKKEENEKVEPKFEEHSKWKDGKAVSGHAATSSFMALVGAETLGMIAEQHQFLGSITKIAKPVLIFSAAGCSLSRIHDDAHYLSQSLSGSVIGAVSAINFKNLKHYPMM